MRLKFLTLLAALLAVAAPRAAAQTAQPAAAAPTDTIYEPNVIFSGMPRVYEIADIKVTGAPNYDEFLILGYTGLKKGDRVAIPGDDITQAVKRLMRQQLFSQARVKVLKTAGDKAWLEIEVRPQPRISQVNYNGAKKGERDDLQERLKLMKGNVITQNIVNRIEMIAKKYYADKGFGNADVNVVLREDLSAPNEMIVDVNVNRHDKVKVHKIYINGNQVLSDRKIQRTMKKTNESGKLLNLFRQKKFVESDYEDDLNRIIEKYNELGYRDAKIVSDSVVPYNEKKVDVHITVDEGKKYYIRDISWVGNTVYPTDVLNTVLDMHPGEVYNQKLMNKRLTEDDDAVSNLYMDNGYLFYNLVPIERDVEGDSISLEMRMMEGPQARINNVVINGNDRLYEGEGQTFTISAQTNARYYQAYSLSFLDPWFGGKRPNSLQVSAFYSRQTGVNSSYYNRQWSDYMYNGYGYGGYGYGYGYGYDNGYNYENAYDPNKVLQMVGINVGFGKRLKWPDDYFTFTAELGYNWYYLKNWEYLYYMNNGTSNALVLGLTLARNSIDNPLYTRSGSSFSLNLQLTPPAQLFTGKRDWKKLSEENTTESKKKLYEWIEYWKLRFKSRTYTPLSNSEKWTPVLMTRADIGLLGSYNKYLKTPFETFYVGGDGMSGSYTYATETIALRGYDNGDLTPWGQEGYAYTRLGVEFHFPLMLQPTTTIYALTFLEGGNAWTKVRDFNPFSMKRSAGAGVRIYLPMVGLMGIDWAYGFDKVRGMRGGSHFHFILGQEF